MSFVDYVIPAGFRSGRMKRLAERLARLEAKLQQTRQQRDDARNKVRATAEELKALHRRHMTDADRCRAQVLRTLERAPADLASLAGKPGAVSSLIDPEDDMIWSSSTELYFRIGMDGARLTAAAVRMGRDGVPPRRVLDIPCGHGRVLRWLRALYGEAEIVCCDIQEHGAAFCAAEFDAEHLPAAVPPSALDPGKRFDAVFVGSLLTHLPREEFCAFIRRLGVWLEPDGVGVITTHGKEVFDKFRNGLDLGVRCDNGPLVEEFAREGFCYVPYRDTPDYGVSFSTREFVERMVASAGMRTIGRDVWDGFQDATFVSRT